MPRKPTTRPSPAMAVAFVALLVALSGTAIALPGKNKVERNDIKRNAVNGKKIARNAVTGGKVRNESLSGADINESTLGKVPSAASADAAGTATSATVAERAGELTGRRIFFRAPPDTAEGEILNLGGLVLRASCSAGGDLAVEAESTVAEGFIQGNSVIDDENVFGNSSADPGDVFNVLPDNDQFVIGFIWYATPGGSVVSVQYQADEDQPSTANNCVFTGTAQQGSPG